VAGTDRRGDGGERGGALTKRRPILRITLGVIAVLALVAAAIWGAWSLGAAPSGAPLPAGPVVAGEANQLSFPREARTRFTYSTPLAFNRGGEPAKIEKVTLVKPSVGLQVIGVMAAGPGRENEYVSGDVVYPPKLRDLHPAEGYAIAPLRTADGKRGVELVIGLTAARPGRYVMRGVQLEYTVGSRHYSRLLPNTLAVCAVPRGGEKSTDCPLGPEVEGSTITDGATREVPPEG
jgi:hypothetical protein